MIFTDNAASASNQGKPVQKSRTRITAASKKKNTVTKKSAATSEGMDVISCNEVITGTRGKVQLC